MSDKLYNAILSAVNPYFYLKVKEETKTIPNLNDLEHGNSFCSDEYNGYDLSYLSIKYLNEILSTEKFRQLMSDFLGIQEYGNNLVYKMFDYYDEQFKIERRKNNIGCHAQ